MSNDPDAKRLRGLSLQVPEAD